MTEENFRKTPISGLLEIDIEVFADSRGWFKENWQQLRFENDTNLLFRPIQNNISMNLIAGTIRGMHAEPWSKFISVASGRVFGAWVDLRAGDDFGKVFTAEITPNKGVFVPAGVANGFQALENETSYSYLVDGIWSEEQNYNYVNFSDPDLGIEWPLGVHLELVSQKDLGHPNLIDVSPIEIPKKHVMVLGGNGQIGMALRKVLPEGAFYSHSEFDLTSDSDANRIDFSKVSFVINAAAFTNVDAAEDPINISKAWNANAVGVSKLVKKCRDFGIPLIHISSDYVFDGTNSAGYLETDHLAPINVYGSSKAAGDLVVATLEKHYIVRTSWVVGEGKNFIEAILRKSSSSEPLRVVDNQVGRLTFAQDIADFIMYLVTSNPEYGTYNFTSDGEAISWADIAIKILETPGINNPGILRVKDSDYYREGTAPRPLNSALSLEKVKKLGFRPTDMESRLTEYLRAKSL